MAGRNRSEYELHLWCHTRSKSTVLFCYNFPMWSNISDIQGISLHFTCAELNALIMLNYYITHIISHIVLLNFAPFGGLLTWLIRHLNLVLLLTSLDDKPRQAGNFRKYKIKQIPKIDISYSHYLVLFFLEYWELLQLDVHYFGIRFILYLLL